MIHRPFAAIGAAALAATLASCSWGIKLDSAGQNVRVAWNGNVSGCKDLGEVSVSVTDKVGFYERNDIKVRDELEVLGRNEAGSMHADTILPRGEPHDGAQRFGAFVCGPARAESRPRRDDRGPPDAHREGAVETYPIKDH